MRISLNDNTIQVAVGVIINDKDEVLIALRPKHKPQGGLWEFPGGKKKSDETIELALEREFLEEISIRVKTYFPLQKIQHSYRKYSVILDVWMITEYAQTPKGAEGQCIEWRSVQSLQYEDFPDANKKIIKILKLPKFLPITPDIKNFESFKKILKVYSLQMISLVQFRQTHLNSEEYLHCFKKAQIAADDYGIRLLFNGELKDFHESEAVGFHANSRRLMQMEKRTVESCRYFGASCHNLIELKKALDLDVDYVSLSPVLDTEKYNEFIGWETFHKLASRVHLPVYALGGVGPKDLRTVRAHGGYGVSGISSWLINMNFSPGQTRSH